MSYTINDANIELEKIIGGERAATLDELNSIFSNLDVTDVNANTNAKTVLYSGMGSSFFESLANNPDVRILNNTQAFEFLEGLKRNEIFAEAWIKITGVKPDWQNDYSGNIDKFIGGVDGNPRTKGAWDIISKNFVEAGSGDLFIYAGEKANPERVFFQTEWEAIKSSTNYTNINGVKYETLMTNDFVNMKSDDAFKAFQITTDYRINVASTLGVNPIELTKEDTESFFTDKKYEAQRNKFISEKLNEPIPTNIEDTGKFTSFLNKVGPLGIVASLVLASQEAAEAYELGDKKKAKDIMTNWGIDTAGSAIGEVGGAIIAGATLGIITAIGLTVGAIPAAIIIGGASIAGGIFGADFLSSFYKLLNDDDNTNTLLDELNNKDLNIIDKIKELLKQASTISSPLVLDINKDGIISTTGKIVNFDLDNNGYAESTGWVDANDGLLVLDKNNNGIIDNGSELFGNNTTLSSGKLAANGFIALADYDLNKDGKIDSSDSIYSQLRVWQDLNQNGINEANELFALNEFNIDTINTTYTTSSTIDQYGNEHKQVGTFTSNGITYNINDVWFSVDKAKTIDLNQVETSEEIAKLPDIKGFGNVSSLHQIMAKDSTGELQKVVKEFVETKNKSLIDEIIFRWTNVYNISPTSRGVNIGDARILEAMENLTGEEFYQNGKLNPELYSSNIIKNAYANFKEFFTRSILKEYQDTYSSLIEINKNTDGTLVADVSKLISFIKVSYIVDTENTLNKINDLMLTLKLNKQEFGFIGKEINTYILNNPSDSYYLDEYLKGFSKDFADMNLYTKNSFDASTFVVGTDNNENTYGSRENDTFVGTKGNDYFSGNYGKDTYLFKLGDGNDTILENSISSENDKIVFGKGIKKEDINIEINGKNLLLKYSNNDSITIKGWNDISSKRVEYFLFEDGSIESIYDETFFNTVINGSSSRDNIDGLNGDDIIYGNGGGDTIYAKKGDDYIVTKEGKDSIYGEEGNDTIYAGAGDDYIVGGEGNDLIYGEDGDDNIRGSSGDDIIIGGKGDDTLSGGNGSDTYIFSKGDGVDSISDDGTDTTEIDKILFTQEITKSDIVFNYNSSNIKISYSNEDLINITSFKSLSKKRVERMELADGSYLTYNDINNIIQQMNAYATTNDIDITNINNIRQDDGLMNIFENSWRQDQIA